MHEQIAEKLFKEAEDDFRDAQKKADAKNSTEIHVQELVEAHRNAKTKEVFKRNELYDDKSVDPADSKHQGPWKADELNISKDALLKILEWYDIAPGACSHIRGQEQIFGARTTKNTKNEISAVGELA